MSDFTFPESQALQEAGAVSIFDADCMEALAEEPDCPECGMHMWALVLRDTSGKKHAFALCNCCGHEEEF
jgi:hypothetical protein